MKNFVFFVVFAGLLTFNVSAQVPETPKDVAAPPEDAVCTESGLCSFLAFSFSLARACLRYTNITTPISTATPASAIKPTPTATDMW